MCPCPAAAGCSLRKKRPGVRAFFLTLYVPQVRPWPHRLGHNAGQRAVRALARPHANVVRGHTRVCKPALPCSRAGAAVVWRGAQRQPRRRRQRQRNIAWRRRLCGQQGVPKLSLCCEHFSSSVPARLAVQALCWPAVAPQQAARAWRAWRWWRRRRRGSAVSLAARSLRANCGVPGGSWGRAAAGEQRPACEVGVCVCEGARAPAAGEH